MKTWEPYITVRAVQPVVAALEALDYAADALLAESGISRTILANAEGRVPHRAMMVLWERARAATKDDHLGIHLAEAAPIHAFGVHAYALLSSPTLREAYQRACRYQRLIHEVTDLTFAEESHEGVLQHALPGGRPVPRHPAEFLVTLWIRFGRLITDTNWSPSLVCFAHDPPSDTREHARIFRSPIRFSSGRTAMHVPNHLLDVPNQNADVGLTGILDDYARGLLKQMPSQPTLSAGVRLQLLSHLSGGVPTAEAIAQALHMSVRTLHRSLQHENTTYRELLSQLRQEHAASHLANPRISIAEVGFLLGFSELSSFYRAFKRWTGKTPADFRAEALHPDPPSQLYDC